MDNATQNLALATALATFIMPILISVVQQPRWSKAVRTVVAIVSSLIGGAATVYFTTPSLFDDGTAMVTVMLTVLVASTSVYNHIYKPLGIRTLESMTSPGDDTIEMEKAIEDTKEAHVMALLDDEPLAGAHLHVDLAQGVARVDDGNGTVYVHALSPDQQDALADLAPRQETDEPQA